MYCQQCGTKIEDGAFYCAVCGAKQVNYTGASVNSDSGSRQNNSDANRQYTQIDNRFAQSVNQQGYDQPNTYSYSGTSVSGTPKKVSFGEAIKLYFVNYVNFTGRSTRSEYWWVVLFNILVSIVLAFIPYVGYVISLAFIIPSLSLSIRRLHDIGKSWVWYLMICIPFFGFIILIVYFCKESDGDNKWGPAPRE